MAKQHSFSKSVSLKEFYKFIPRNPASKGRASAGLGMMNLTVYLGLKVRADNRNIVQISYRDLADFLGVSKSGAQKSVYQLEKAQLIKRLPPASKTAIPEYKILG